MITQSNLVRHRGYFSRMMALPLVFVLVSAFAVKLTHRIPEVTALRYASKTIMVVIDPGHGGSYTGVRAANGLVEKDITLSIAQKIKELSKEYNVNILLTRNTDELVGSASTLKEDLTNRVSIASNANPDLFLSLHVNATYEKTTLRSGFDAYISGRNEHPKDRQIASTLLTSLKDIYAVNENIEQREIGIIVLDKNTCPSVCLECGYMTNPKDAAFISNTANQEKIARKILEGIVLYSNAQVPAAAFYQPDINSPRNDTLSPEELNKLNVNDIQTIKFDKQKNYASIAMKNGDTKIANLEKLNNYFAVHPARTPPADFQVESAQDTVPDKIFTKVETEADYPGWTAYLFKNLVYPQKAIDKEIHGTVVVQFIVDENGKVSDVKALSGPALLKAESIRIVKESGSWNSAVQNGKKVKSYKKQPIIYKLERQG